MDVYVLRHGLANARSRPVYSNDDERPLTAKGIRRMDRQARGMNAIGLSPDVTFTSPLVRAAQTAEIVHRRLDDPGELVTTAALAPSGDPRALIDQIAAGHSSADSIMLVGHEPYLSALISRLVTGDTASVIRLKKGTLCKLRVPNLRYGRCGWIEWSLTPRQMVNLR